MRLEKQPQLTIRPMNLRDCVQTVLEISPAEGLKSKYLTHDKDNTHTHTLMYT